jgi:hypothetical protein
MNTTASKKTQLSKRGEKPSAYRRIVTGNVNGKSVVQSDEPLRAYEFKTVPGYKHTLVWVNPETPDLGKEQKFDRYPDTVVPGPGGSSLHFVTFPPGSVFADPSFDGEAAQKESLVRLPGLADHFEKDLLKFLVPLHVMAELAGLSVSVRQAAVPRDAASETHSVWTVTFTGIGGKQCTMKWRAIRRWDASRVVYEHHYDHQLTGGPLTLDDLHWDFPRSDIGLRPSP